MSDYMIQVDDDVREATPEEIALIEALRSTPQLGGFDAS